MDNALYLKAAMLTFSVRPAQFGLRRVAGNGIRTSLMHAGFGLHNEMTEFMTAIEPWLTGESQWKPEFDQPAKDELGDVGYFLRILTRYLKIKLPSATKKVKLKGMTRTAAILRMNALAGKVASLQKKNFYGPVMKYHDFNGELVFGPGPGIKASVDAEASKQQEALRNAATAEVLAEFVQLYWALCFDLLKVTPSDLFDLNIEKLKVRYPKGTFDAIDEANKNPVAEAAAQQS